MSATEGHSRASLNRSVEQGFAELADILASLPEAGPAIRWNISCAFHCPFGGVVPAARVPRLVERVAALRATPDPMEPQGFHRIGQSCSIH